MTREEAKGNLIDIRNKYLANYGEDSIINILIDEYDIQAIDIAIKALEQEPSSDCISRQEAIDTIRQLYIDLAIQKYVIDILKALPSVKPQESCDVPDTNVGDIISKQTVLDTISELNAISFYEAQEDSRETYYEIRQAIKDLSPVKQEPKTVIYSGDGYADGYMVYDMAECPTCGYEYDYGDKDWGLPFCPNCGQKLNWERND